MAQPPLLLLLLLQTLWPLLLYWCLLPALMWQRPPLRLLVLVLLRQLQLSSPTGQARWCLLVWG